MLEQNAPVLQDWMRVLLLCTIPIKIQHAAKACFDLTAEEENRDYTTNIHFTWGDTLVSFWEKKISFVSHVVKRKDIHDFFWSVSLDQNYFRFNILQNTLNGCERIAASALTEPKLGWNKNKQKQFLQKNETWSDTKEWNSLPVGFQISSSGRCVQLFGWSGMFAVCLDLTSSEIYTWHDFL